MLLYCGNVVAVVFHEFCSIHVFVRQHDDIAPNKARAARLFNVLAFVGIEFAFTYGPDALRLKTDPPTAPRASESIGENLSFAMVLDFIYTTVP